jgi:hypothetical protein
MCTYEILIQYSQVNDINMIIFQIVLDNRSFKLRQICGEVKGKKYKKQKCGNVKEIKAQIKATSEPYYFITEITYEKEKKQ